MIAFFGISLPESIRETLATLASGVPHIRWIDQSQLHLTLRYLGEMSQLDLEDLLEEISLIRAKPFEISLKGVGVFPTSGNPKTLWVGLSTSPLLISLRNKIERVCQAFGLEPEHRKFRPHITIGRMDNPQLNRLIDYLKTHILFQSDLFTVTEFHLYSSHRTHDASTYSIETTFELQSIL